MSSTNDTQANNTHAKGNTMRAVVWEGKPFEIAVRDVPRPKIELPEDAIVRITTAALCGSDLHTYHCVLGSPTPPWIMGHEGIGVVVEVGQATEHFKVGDRVLIPGVADPGFFSIDKTAGDQGLLYGMGPAFGGVEGGSQAEYLRVPFADDSLVAIPDDFSSDLDWLFLSDIFVTGWVGLDFAGFKTGDSVAIFGAGPVGLMCAYAALFRGASKVYVIDHIRDRLDKAASIGAIPVNFTSEAGTASEQILQREPNGVDRSVDCIGQACLNHRLKPQQNYVIQEAVRVTKFLGGIGLVGVYAALGKSAGTPLGDTMDKDLSVSIPDLWRKTLSIRGGSVGPYYYDILPKAFELVRSGRVRLDWVTTSRVGIEGAPKAYERFNNKLEIKVVIRFPWVRDQVLASSTEVGDQEATHEVRDQSGERRPLRLPGQRKNRERFMF